jgi:hypothetical protein
VAAGETLEGARLPDAVMGEPGPGWEAWEPPAAPGSYMRVRSGSIELIYVVHPDGHAGSIGPQHHTWTWHADGTVTVSPSIVTTHAEHGHDWHGFLKRGVWSEV